MLQLIFRLRHKSKATKDQLAFAGAALITGLIAVVWLVSLPQQLIVAPVKNTTVQEEPKGAFSQFFTGAKAQFANVLSSGADTSSSTATSSEPVVVTTSSSIVIPTLTAEEVSRLNPKQILIATSSSVEN